MGVWGTSDVTGKEAAKDLHNRKKTLPILLAMARATEPQATALQTFFSAESDDLAAVLTVLEETGAEARSRKSLAEHLSNAVAALRYARITHEARDDMCTLAHELTGQLVSSS